MKPRPTYHPDYEALLRIMARHGFVTAAATMRPHEVLDWNAAIRTWDHYPASMGRYPKRLVMSPKRTP